MNGVDISRRATVRTRAGLGAAAAAAVAALVITLTAAPASAASYSINGTLQCGGALAAYENYRPHSTGGSSIQLTRTDWFWAGNGVRFGLRTSNGVQQTQSVEFGEAERSTKSFRTNGGSTSIPGGSYAVNARVAVYNGNGSCRVFPPSFEATLNL